jgi:hypothetical protein
LDIWELDFSYGIMPFFSLGIPSVSPFFFFFNSPLYIGSRGEKAAHGLMTWLGLISSKPLIQFQFKGFD